MLAYAKQQRLLTWEVLQEPVQSDAGGGEIDPQKTRDRLRTTDNENTRVVPRELQFAKPGRTSSSDWRFEMEKRVNETASDVSDIRTKIDLLLRLQMAGTRSGTTNFQYGGAAGNSNAGAPATDIAARAENNPSPELPRTSERACSASGITHETRLLDHLACDTSKKTREGTFSLPCIKASVLHYRF